MRVQAFGTLREPPARRRPHRLSSACLTKGSVMSTQCDTGISAAAGARGLERAAQTHTEPCCIMWGLETRARFPPAHPGRVVQVQLG